ncbi:uncharacterized protein LOC142768479 isoform X2 [Rhipicephalus microplus]|uniref:uncharacterized protein LOC142768479 isoform X2 n=1 Tax=Rhipicephalus microplus TaxID=6941 RepID=UPI003F6AA2EE
MANTRHRQGFTRKRVVQESSKKHQSFREPNYDGRELEKNLYHNKERMSSLIIERTESGIKVQGILNHQQRIASVATTYRTIKEGIPHQIFEIEDSSFSPSITDNKNHDGTGDTTRVGPLIAGENAATKNQLQVFWVEVCIVVSTNYSSHFTTTESLLTYLASMLNSDHKLFGETSCGSLPKSRFNKEEHITVCGYDAEETLNTTRDYVNLCEPSPCDIVYHITQCV